MARVRTYKQLNHTIKVSYRKRVLDADGEALMGECDPDTGKLHVATIAPTSGLPVPEEIIEHSRWHEQVHYMFKLLGRDELYEDEALVDSMAGLLAQYESTLKRR